LSDKDLLTSSYDYLLPKELIATSALSPADEAKLLVYDTKKDTITHTIFKHILDFLPSKLSVILNNTKVIKARIFGKKQSGGKIELLLNKPMQDNSFLVYIKGRIKVGNILYFDANLTAIIKETNDDGSRIVEFYQDDKILDFTSLIEILDEIGHIPLPPYINREDNIQDEKDYQTLFAKYDGSVAAPTASLHFTDSLLDEFKSRFDIGYLTLHVGAGTFKPIEVDEILSHDMHSEYYEINDETQNLINDTPNILAVGTTVTRTVEYFARTNQGFGECDLFLHPQNRPIRVNHLLTNFHLPKSTLIMLVSSFIGRKKALEIYEIAIKERYRFYSYGDAMLII
jgi:S-adenosylmethionine:tRNA ribosyltransferase-isomerase